MRLFKFINIRFDEVKKDTSDLLPDYLNCEIQLNPFALQSYSVEIEGTNSSGDIGVAGTFGYEHKNLFRGAEILDINIRGAVEAMKKRYNNQFDNTVEFGSEVRIRFPKFILPFFSELFVKRYNPKTQVAVSYNYQQRPDYTRTIVNGSFGYTWKGSRNISHMINPIELNFVKLPNTPQLEEFLDRIKNYPYIVNSYKDHLIAVTNYSFIFNNQDIQKNTNFMFFRWNFESAGNILSAVYDISGQQKIDDAYQLFGTRYAQYLLSDIDIRYYQNVNKTDKIAYRLFVGCGYPYNNSLALPFEKKYFSGGANSIRAWQVRTLGPGSFTDTLSSYPNSLGDVKLEFNLEYRFDIFWVLEGALFLDAGNIWAIRDVEERENTIFRFDRFYEDIAIGTGFGTRFDFSFFVFRLDMGLKTRDPALSSSNKWIIGNQKLSWQDHFNLVLAIGYPF